MYVCILHEHVLMGEKVVYVCVWGGGGIESKSVCVCEGGGEWLAKPVVL